MKRLSLLFLLFPVVIAQAQTSRHIKIELDTKDVKYFTTDSVIIRQVADAFRIANVIFNSAAFQKEIANMSFDANSYWLGSDKIPKNQLGRISGETVLDTLFKETTVRLGFDLKENGNELGSTKIGSYHTTACYIPIQEDMPELNSFTLALTANLCHEYMHQVGFRHLYCSGPFCPRSKKLRERNNLPDPKFINEDVTYKVGWAAYYILMAWKKDGVEPLAAQ